MDGGARRSVRAAEAIFVGADEREKSDVLSSSTDGAMIDKCRGPSVSVVLHFCEGFV